MHPKSRVLIIAGSDSSGGAGIQADIKTVTALGSYATTAITAVTAQNTKGVKKITPIPAKTVEAQLMMVLDDIGADAVKIGMLHNKSIIKCVYKILKKYNLKNIIIDPVMIAKGGFRLIDEKAIKTLREDLMKKAYLLTPNIPEAEVLTKTKIKNLEDMIRLVFATRGFRGPT